MDTSDSTNMEMDPREVENLLKEQSSSFQLVDVREDWELVKGTLPGALHVPLSKFTDYQDQWKSNVSYIVYCEHGVRSLDVVMWLAQNKGIQAKSMRGGYTVWRGPVETSLGGSINP